MSRRLCALLLVLVCAIAPALPALEFAAKADDDCACGHDCCAAKDCAPPPAAPVRAPLAAATVESRQVAAKPATRAVFSFACALFSAQKISAAPAVASVARVAASAASVALFQAHCSLRL